MQSRSLNGGPIPARAICHAASLIVIGLALGLLAESPSAAADSPSAPLPQSPPGQGPTDPAELRLFADDLFADKMSEYHIPGAALVVVKDGRVLYAEGYGYADLEREIAFDPDDTVVRAKSISKLFTATALMQIYEQGMIAFDADVNDYLSRFKVEENWPRPVTVANLLTHTSGWNDPGIGTFARTPEGVQPLGEYLAANMPPRRHPPGEIVRYGDHNMTLAGYIVETVSGTPFEQYIDKQILQRLGMASSSFAQPRPPDLADRLATGYTFQGGSYHAQPTSYSRVGPASGLVTTASDLAIFAIAHLKDGHYGGERILEATTARVMHQQHFTHHPKLPGFAYGFYEHFENGLRAIMHGGEGHGFANMLFLIPDEDMGLVILANRRDFGLHEDFVTEFLDRYYPEEPPQPPQPPPASQGSVSRYAGVYRWYRHDPDTIEKLGSQEETTVEANSDGTITWDQERWLEIEPLLFQSVDGRRFIAFGEDAEGHIDYLFSDDFALAYGRLRWYEPVSFHLKLLAAVLMVFVSALGAPGLGALWRRLRHERGDVDVRTARLARWTALGVAGLSLAFVIAFGLTLVLTNVTVEGAANPFDYGMPWYVVLVLCIPLAVFALTVYLALFTGLAWWRRYWSLGARLHYTLVLAAAFAFLWHLDYWNLLGFQY